MNITALILTIVVALFGIACSTSTDKEPEWRNIGPNAPASLVVYFKKGTTDEQINDFLEKVLYVPDPRGRGRRHVEGVGMITITPEIDGHKGYAITFLENASAAQRGTIKESILSSPIVHKVFANVAPSDVKEII